MLASQWNGICIQTQNGVRDRSFNFEGLFQFLGAVKFGSALFRVNLLKSELLGCFSIVGCEGFGKQAYKRYVGYFWLLASSVILFW